MQTKYLIIGSSHAGLTAAEEVRMHDTEGSLVMVTMEDCLPYSIEVRLVRAILGVAVYAKTGAIAILH